MGMMFKGAWVTVTLEKLGRGRCHWYDRKLLVVDHCANLPDGSVLATGRGNAEPWCFWNVPDAQRAEVVEPLLIGTSCFGGK